MLTKKDWTTHRFVNVSLRKGQRNTDFMQRETFKYLDYN